MIKDRSTVSDWLEIPKQAFLYIKRNSDGLVVLDDSLWDYHSDSIWCDGNFACDCNRSDFFHQAAKLDVDYDDSCGNERYSVKLIDSETKEVLYNEFD